MRHVCGKVKVVTYARTFLVSCRDATGRSFYRNEASTRASTFIVAYSNLIVLRRVGPSRAHGAVDWRPFRSPTKFNRGAIIRFSSAKERPNPVVVMVRGACLPIQFAISIRQSKHTMANRRLSRSRSTMKEYMFFFETISRIDRRERNHLNRSSDKGNFYSSRIYNVNFYSLRDW